MNGLANTFPFVRNFILKILGFIGTQDYDTGLVDTSAGLINLFIILLMCASVFCFIYAGVLFAFRHQNSNIQEVEKKSKQAKGLTIGGAVLLSLPLLAMIVIAIANSALPS